MWGAAWCQDAWDAVGQVITANIPEALATLAAAVNVAGTTLLAAGTYVVAGVTTNAVVAGVTTNAVVAGVTTNAVVAGVTTNTVVAGVTTNATAVFNVLSGSLPTLIDAPVAQGRLVATSATAVVTNTVAALSAGNIEDAWNAAVDGLLGPTGLPDTVRNLSIGQGMQIAPITGATPADIQAFFAAGSVPSILTELHSETRQIVVSATTRDRGGRLCSAASPLLAGRLLLVETTPEAILHTTAERTTSALATTLTGCTRRGTTLAGALRRRTGDGEHDTTEHHQETDHR
jgi:hypothetical protein